MKVLFKSKKRAVFSIITLFLVLVVLINVCVTAFFSFALFRKDGWKKFEEYSYGKELKTTSEWISDNSEKAEIKNADGKTLTALMIENEHISHSYIIICHQYGGNPYSMEEYVQHFYDLGFNIILPWMRGHTESSYDRISFGWEDGFDVADWVESITKEDSEAKIALFGVSLGANAVTLSASGELSDNVRLVIADSCYTSLEALVKEYVKNETPFSSFLVSKLTSAFVKKHMGEAAQNSDTVAEVKNIELPIMFINGEDDIVVPALVSKRLYENCEADGVEEVLIENGTHGRNLEADKDSYWTNIDAFILNNLGI